MTTYAAIQNPTDWNWKKKYKWMEKRKAKSRDIHKWQKQVQFVLLNKTIEDVK